MCGKIKEAWYGVTDRIAEKWYGSKAQAYFLTHQAGVCMSTGILLLIVALAIIISTAVQPSLLKMAAAAVCMISGAVISFIGVGIKSVEGG